MEVIEDLFEFILFFLILIGSYLLIRYIFNGPYCNIISSLSGKVVIITGASDGIGKETAKSILLSGGEVVFACRNEEKTLKVISELTSNNNLLNKAHFIKLDLNSFESVKNFVNKFKNNFNHLDLLINNAGGLNPKLEFSENGYEKTLQIDHLSVVYLTSLLYDIIEKSEGKIITIGSEAHKYAKYDINVLIENNEKTIEKLYTYFGFSFYAISKLGNNFMTKFFAEYNKRRQLKEENFQISNVYCFTVHPGCVLTNANRNISFDNIIYKGLYYLLVLPIMLIFFKTPEAGAQTTLFCSYLSNSQIQQGKYYSNCSIGNESELANDKLKMQEFMKFSYDQIRKKVNDFDFDESLVFKN